MKKASLFISTQMRELMETKMPAGHIYRGLSQAFKLPAQLLYIAYTDGYSEEVAKDVAGDAWEYFTAGHNVFEQICLVFRQAYRMETYVRPAPDNKIKLDIRLYRKGAKKPYFDMKFLINHSNAIEPCGMGFHEM